jgi:nucleoside-diphosphate-sugar epimerase
MVTTLKAAGWDVVGCDVRAYYPEDTLDFFRDGRSEPCDLLVHCAAVVNGRQTIEYSPMDQVVDFELDAAMFRWAAAGGAQRVVYFSSSAAYPVRFQREAGLRLTEADIRPDSPEQPDALYGWSKLTGERLAATARSAGLDVLVVRPFSGYGTDQDDCYPFPAIIARAARHEDPLTVWGTGNQARDFVHVDDICAAIMALLDAGVQGPVNIGTGRPTTMRDLARLAAAYVGYDPKIVAIPGPEGVAWRVCDPTLLHRYYKPTVTLEQGVTEAVKEATNR